MKVYDSQGRLKVVGFTGPVGPVGVASVTCAELSATASLLSVAIDIVSNGLSALTVAHDILSNRVSTNSATGGGGSVTSAEVQVASAAATSADAHAATASAAATSADAHANTVSARVVSASAELVSLIQIASAAATSADTHAATASAAATSADGHANTASAAATSADLHANTVSARVVSVSAEVVSLIQIASAAATSADAHANTASAAATSADAHANTASAAATSVDGRIASLSAGFASLSARSVGNVSTHGFQSIINALSNRISGVTGGTGSVTSTELSAASAQALSAHRNLLRIETVTSASGPTSVPVGIYYVRTGAASAGDGTVSIPAMSVGMDGRRILVVNKSLAVAKVVATPPDIFNGGTSAASITLTNIWDNVLLIANGVDGWDVVLEKGAVTGGTGSVTSTELSAGLLGVTRSVNFLQLRNDDGLDVSAGSPVFLATSAASTFHVAAGQDADVKEAIGMAVTTIAVGATGDIQTRGVVSLTSAQWDARTGQTGGLTIGSKYYLAVTAGDLSLAPALDAARPVGVAIAKVKMLLGFGLVDDSKPFLDGLSAFDFDIAQSVHGLQSIINAMSVQTAVAINGVSAANAIAAAALSLANAVSARVVSVSAELASLVQIASAAATSADGHANTVSARAVSISAELGSLLASTSAALRADITSVSAVIKADIASVSAVIMADVASHLNSASGAIMVDVASHLTSTSALIKADIASVSVAIKADITSVSAVIKADITSVSAAIINEVSVQIGRGQFKMVTTGDQAVATATFTKVSGLSLSIVASGFYEIHGQLIWSQSETASTSSNFNFGMSMTAQPVMAMFKMVGNTGVLGAAGGLSAFTQFGGQSAICATPSIMYSAKPNVAASASVTGTMFFDGVLQASTVQSQLKVVVACSTGDFGIAIKPGSWVRAYRIG